MVNKRSDCKQGQNPRLSFHGTEILVVRLGRRGTGIYITEYKKKKWYYTRTLNANELREWNFEYMKGFHES